MTIGSVPTASSHGSRPSNVPGSRNIAAGSCDEVLREVREHRDQRAELDHRGVRRAGIGLAEQRGHDAQVRRRRDRNEFGEALDQAEESSEPERHRCLHANIKRVTRLLAVILLASCGRQFACSGAVRRRVPMRSDGQPAAAAAHRPCQTRSLNRSATRCSRTPSRPARGAAGRPADRRGRAAEDPRASLRAAVPAPSAARCRARPTIARSAATSTAAIDACR